MIRQALLLLTASAQEPEPPAAEIVVTASRLPAAAEATPYSVAIIPEERLVGRTSVADALSEIADIYVQTPGGRSGPAAIFLRGADPNFTAVLLDGVALNNSANALGGAFNVSEIASAGIDRIEIVTGPLSSLYGSGALAGVVNLIVPGGSAASAFDGRLGVGTAEDVSGFSRWRGPLGRGYGASLAATYDDAGDEAPPSRFRSAALLGKIAPLGREDAGRVLFRIADTRSRAFPDASGGPRLAVIRDLERRDSREALVGASQPILTGHAIRFDLSGSYLARRDRTDSPGVAASDANPVGVPAGEDRTRYRRASGQAAARYDANGWQAIAGVEAIREVARSEGELNLFGMAFPSGFRDSRWTRSGFVEASRTMSDLVVNAGARLDRVDGVGTHFTGRVGARYVVPGTRLSLRAAAGTGFKAPSFYALGNPFVGNPALDPERSRAVEAGVQWKGADGADVSLTAFHTRYRNLIDFVPDPVPRLENRGVVISKGVSAAASRAFGDRFAASAQLAFTDTRDRDSGERLLNRPRWRSSSTVTWMPTDAVALIGRHRFVGKRLGFSVPTGVVGLSGHHLLSAEAAWTIQAGPTVRIVVENALDADGEDAVGFPTPGRRARILIQKEF